MPELPEVETTRQGIKPYIEGHRIKTTTIRQYQLRWPIPADLAEILQKQKIHRVNRRAKYILIHCDSGILIIHLGMSGSLRVLDTNCPPEKHDHVDIEVDNGYILRFTDPRRFGAILWTEDPVEQHKLIKHLGPEPLTTDFSPDYLFKQCRSRRCSIKTLLMNGKIVVGVGNIYANEALFHAKINPLKPAADLSKAASGRLVSAVKNILAEAIKAGGTTLKDFRQSDGKPGYFAQQLNIYGKKGENCPQCGSSIELVRESQRATYFCPCCQK